MCVRVCVKWGNGNGKRRRKSCGDRGRETTDLQDLVQWVPENAGPPGSDIRGFYAELMCKLKWAACSSTWGAFKNTNAWALP